MTKALDTRQIQRGSSYNGRTNHLGFLLLAGHGPFCSMFLKSGSLKIRLSDHVELPKPNVATLHYIPLSWYVPPYGLKKTIQEKSHGMYLQDWHESHGSLCEVAL
jgi:hypothetical protein